MEVEDELSNFVADLLSYQENEAFLKQLFELQTGKWAKVVELCDSLPIFENADNKVKELAQDLRVVWLDLL
jgi:hypothetical protein